MSEGKMSEITEAFFDIASWDDFISENEFLYDPAYIRRIVDHAVSHGVESALLGTLGPEQVTVSGENFRETLAAANLNPRHRAIMELVAKEPWVRDPMGARIYAAEALTRFALA